MDYPEFTFEKPDTAVFRNLEIAFEAITQGGIIPCVMNAANEIAVSAFLKDKIGFLQMSDIIEKTISQINNKKIPSINDYLYADEEARNIAASFI